MSIGKNLPLAEVILNQTEFYNNHGQMEVNVMSLQQLLQLVKDLVEIKNTCFYLKLYFDVDQTLSASIYECDGIAFGDDKLWFGVERVQS